MALTEREKQAIDAISENQRRLEMMIAGLLGGNLAQSGVRLSQANPFDSPLVNPSSQNRRVASAAKREGIKTRRKVSKYQREFGRQLKKLKKKHPRTNISTLMKRSHTATKRSLKIRVPRRK